MTEAEADRRDLEFEFNPEEGAFDPYEYDYY